MWVLGSGEVDDILEAENFFHFVITLIWEGKVTKDWRADSNTLESQDAEVHKHHYGARTLKGTRKIRFIL